MKAIKVALADDHTLVRNALANLISSYDGYEVVLQADNGRQLIESIAYSPVLDLVLLDINMPVMDGYETCLWLRDNYPDIKVLALSMYDKEYSIIRMLRNGARGYILKDIDPKEFKSALDTFVNSGYYYSGIISNRLVHAINKMDDASETIQSLSLLSDQERALLKLICTEMTYKEIADQMKISPRTVDSYREGLFEKLNVRSRVGLVIYAIRNGIVSVD